MDLSKKISAFVCGTDCTEEDERSVIEFGVRILLSKMLNLITEIIIGCLFSMLFETVIFLLAFSFLRSYAGGFHASSSLKCYISSSAIMAAALLIIRYTDMPIVNIVFAVFGMIICLVLAPVESKNKYLDEIERTVYRKRALIILFLILLAMICSYFLHINSIFTTLSVVLLIEGIMLILGKMQLK
ncbi:MAG: accessory gene regulator B family protein [Alistipes sp.]|nr:accessory gene regulator B family protein [Alistipes sp.]